MTSHHAHVRKLAAGAVIALAAVTLSACSDTTSGSGSQAGSAGTAAGGSSSGGSAASGSGNGSSGTAGSVNELAAAIVSGTSEGTTVHLVLATSGAGASAASAGSGEGDVRTADGGKTDAFDVAVGSGSSALTLVYVDGTGYVKLPTAQQTDPSKPWAKVSDSSSNPVVKAVSAAFDQIDDQTSLTQYANLVKSASNFEATGASTVDGTAVQGYSFDVDPKDLPNASQLGSAISSIGPIPTTMAVDEKGRPVQVVEKISFGGQSITTTVTFSDYGKDVDISAPPADQTSTD